MQATDLSLLQHPGLPCSLPHHDRRHYPAGTAARPLQSLQRMRCKVSTFAAEALAAGSLARAGSTAVGHNITTALCIRPLKLAVR